MSEEITTIGSKLRQARIDKGISLEEAYKKTKIHVNILNAIEQDKLRDFSPAYMKGFLKIYTQYLGLDIQEIIQQYQGLFEPKAEAVAREDKPKAKIKLDLFPSRIKLGFKVFLVICIIFIFGRMISSLKNRNKISATAKVETAKEDTVIPVKKAGPIKLAIRVKEDCWIQVICDGKKMFEGMLKKGMKESWSAKDEIKFSVGNAGGLEIEVNDKIFSPLGRRGQVLRDIIITKEGISIIEKHR